MKRRGMFTVTDAGLRVDMSAHVHVALTQHMHVVRLVHAGHVCRRARRRDPSACSATSISTFRTATPRGNRPNSTFSSSNEAPAPTLQPCVRPGQSRAVSVHKETSDAGLRDRLPAADHDDTSDVINMTGRGGRLRGGGGSGGSAGGLRQGGEMYLLMMFGLAEK